MKKLLLIISCIFLINTTYAQNYYVSNTDGNDSNSGSANTQAWKTLDRLNTAMASGQIKSGDKIFFHRDNTFYGTLNVTVSGLTFDAYGSGVKPRLDGSTLLTNWQQTGTNKWTTTCNSCGNDIRSLSINDEFQRFARYPNYDAANGGYLIFENSNIQTVSSSEKYTLSITDNQLSNSPNWTGAEIVVRNRHWKLDKAIVSQHNGGTIVFDTKLKGQVTNNYGYFFQNHPQALNQIGEFTYGAASKEFQLMSSVNPNNLTVTTTISPYVINISGQSNISLNNLQISGGLERNVYMESANQITFDNCLVNNGATNGIVAINSTYVTIQNSTIENIQNNGIYLGPPNSNPINHYNAHHVEIAHSTIRNIAMVAGMGQSKDGQYNGIAVIGDNTNIHHNTISNIGYLGLSFKGSNTLITNNFIEYFCLVKDDGAGIYTWNNIANPLTFTNQQIKNNIVINGTGAPEGANRTYGRADGIYIDDGSDNIVIQDNVCANNSESGIHIHNSGTQTIENNLLFNNLMQLFLSQDNDGRQLIRNFVFENNCAISNTAEQQSIYTKTRGNDIEQFGSIDNNYYSEYNNGGKFEYKNSNIINEYSFNQWQSTIGYDASSVIVQDGPYTFHYNKSDNSLSIPLSGNYIDVKGNTYSGNITLAPWSGVVLTPAPGGCQTSVVINAAGDEGLELMTLEINGENVKEWIVTTNYQDYNFTYNGTIESLFVHLSNHDYIPEQGIDYNLNVDYIIVDGNTIQTNAPETYGKGVNVIDIAGYCNEGSNFTTEKLYCKGYFQYSLPTQNTACDDGDECTVNDTYNADCNCIGTFVDTDGDDVCDADDVCANGDDNIDNNNNGTPDACEDTTYYFITNRKTGDRFYPENDAHEAPLRKADPGRSDDWVQWEKIPTTSGYFYLKNKATGKYIRPQNDNDAVPVWQVPTNYTGSYTQWTEVRVNNSDYYYLQNRATGKHIRSQSDTPDAPIQQQPNTWTGHWTQWTIEPINAQKLQTDKLTFNLYPNPADDYIRIDAQNIQENSSLSIYDVSGKLVIHQPFTLDTYDISTQELKAGIYLVRLDIGNGTYAVQRFVIQ